MKHPVKDHKMRLAPVLLLLGLAAMASPTAVRAAFQCPAIVQGHSLTGFSLFEGDPARQIELAPGSTGDNSGYVNTWKFRSSAALVAVCHYKGAADLQTPLPAGLSVCRAQGSSRQVRAACQ